MGLVFRQCAQPYFRTPYIAYEAIVAPPARILACVLRWGMASQLEASGAQQRFFVWSTSIDALCATGLVISGGQRMVAAFGAFRVVIELLGPTGRCGELCLNGRSKVAQYSLQCPSHWRLGYVSSCHATLALPPGRRISSYCECSLSKSVQESPTWRLASSYGTTSRSRHLESGPISQIRPGICFGAWCVRPPCVSLPDIPWVHRSGRQAV